MSENMSAVKAVASTGSRPSKADRDLVAQARARYKLAVDALTDSREFELDDLRFMAGSPDNQWQWPQDVLQSRSALQGQAVNARPCLTINKLPQHVKQVTNDQKQNRPEGKVIPVDDKADPEVADALNGIIRHIEYLSDADIAYDTANENQVTFGEGYWRILSDFVDETSFEQDLRIGRIKNSFSVFMDPTGQDPCGSDAQWCLITQDMLREDFEEQYPDAIPNSAEFSEGVGDTGIDRWITDKAVRVAEYFYYETEEKMLCLYHVPGTGKTSIVQGSKEEAMAKLLGGQPIMRDGKPVERKTQIKHVKWCKTNGYRILERRDWPGKWIPVIRCVGNEWEVDGEIVLSGLVRNAKDAQRMYNYWTSQEAEMLALAPKAPFIMYEGQNEGFEDLWARANIDNTPVLFVNRDAQDQAGNPLPLPQRVAPPMPQTGLLQAKMGAADDIKGTTGQYDPSLGAQSNEKSGKAILARERQSDTGTYHYLDNFMKAKRFSVRQLLDLIPKYYDTQRIARIIGIDGEVSTIKVDPNQRQPVITNKDQNGGVIDKIFNLGIGRYDVMATTGPSYMTKRQEAMNAMAQLLQGNPELWKIAGDLFIKNMDWPGAQEMAKRFAKTIPPEIKDDSEDSPEVAQLKKIVEGQGQQLQQMQAAIQQLLQAPDMIRARNDVAKTRISAFDAETKRMQAEGKALNDGAQLFMQAQEAALAAQPEPEPENPNGSI